MTGFDADQAAHDTAEQAAIVEIRASDEYRELADMHQDCIDIAEWLAKNGHTLGRGQTLADALWMAMEKMVTKEAVAEHMRLADDGRIDEEELRTMMNH